jgi:agmatine deiminase
MDQHRVARHPDARPPTRCFGAALSLLAALVFAMPAPAARYLPEESAPHEATWLQWPHHHQYGRLYRNRLEATWVAMTAALVASEPVHIIVYDRRERRRVARVLRKASVPLGRVRFLVAKTNDTWVRDNGPIFVIDTVDGDLQATDWGFNGWGLDAPYRLDDTVPIAVADALGVPRVDRSAVVLEGGAIEVDGRGTLMATRSSILDPDRNPDLSQQDVEAAMAADFGIRRFIWLDGRSGGRLDITDTHIDAIARFADPHTIVTMRAADLVHYGLSPADAERLLTATDAEGAPYRRVQLPLTANEVVTDSGYELGFKGSYVNFYTANTVVLMPTYDDPNDDIARGILQSAYPEREVIGIDVRNLYRYGGMIHCVTQQQPQPQRMARPSRRAPASR